MDANAGIDFYRAIQPFSRFAGVVDPANYRTLPAGWVIGVSDVVNSTGAIAEGRYKAVNMVGAAVISAVRNALGGIDFPFVFGGDGASFALPSANAPAAARAMAEVRVWAREEMELELRAAIVPMPVIRAAGHDALVGRYAPSPHVTYAMFSGGGVAWAEREMKAGRHLVAPAAPGSRPDLQGLSCHWSPMRSARGVILSVLVVPEGEADVRFLDLIGEVLELAREQAPDGRPFQSGDPAMRPVTARFDFETKVSSENGRRTPSAWKLRLTHLVGRILFGAGLKVGGFDPRHYLATLKANTDFRKFDDGLKLTLDCTQDLADRLERLLERASREGVCRYGLHRQSEAIMTCIVPSLTSDDHIHFVDGAEGGYAAAAGRLKGHSVERA